MTDAEIKTETLSDGSKIYNVEVTLDRFTLQSKQRNLTALFPCINEDNAIRLVAALDAYAISAEVY